LCVGFGQTFSRKETAIFYKDYQKASRERVKAEAKTEEEDGVKVEEGSQAIPSVVKYWVELKERAAEEARANPVDQAIKSETKVEDDDVKVLIDSELEDEQSHMNLVKLEPE